jgi:hypothetical protein
VSWEKFFGLATSFGLGANRSRSLSVDGHDNLVLASSYPFEIDYGTGVV